MGSKTFIAFRPLIRAAAQAGIAASVMTLLAACISDGPNRTGGQFLSTQDIRFQTPLYHVQLPDFPVDSIWTSDMDLSHFGDSILMVGKDGDFRTQVRMAFDISDTNFLDSLGDTTSRFKISLGPYLTTGSGMNGLKNSVGNGPDSASGVYRDSMPILVEAWAIPDTNSDGEKLTAAQRLDTVNIYNRRFLQRQDTTAMLPKVMVRDTIQLHLKGAYTKDSLQARALPNLWKLLHGLPTSSKVLVQLQLTPLPDTLKGPAMLRIDSRYGSTYIPTLLFGSPVNSLSAVAKQKIAPMLYGTAYWVNYILHYAGSDLDIVPAKKRNLHMLLNRASLLEKIGQELLRQGHTVPQSSINGKFDLTYFLPFGKISIPVDPAHMRGQFPMEFYLQSDLDSLVPAADPNSISVKEFALGTPGILVYSYDHNNPDEITDSISISYRKAQDGSPDSNLRQIIIKFAKDSTRNDSSFIRIGDTRIKSVGVGTGNPALQLTMVAESNGLQVGYYLAGKIVTEANEFRDPETGKLLTTLAERVPRLYQDHSDVLAMKATHGLQVLLNRADAGKEIFPDLVLVPSLAVDTAATIGGSTQPQYIPYPVLSVIPLGFTSGIGKLSVSLDLYLYPLKKGL